MITFSLDPNTDKQEQAAYSGGNKTDCQGKRLRAPRSQEILFGDRDKIFQLHHVRSDIQPAIEAIQSGEFIGDRIPGTEYVVFKARVRNRDIQKGKSSGYRLIHQVKRRSRLY